MAGLGYSPLKRLKITLITFIVTFLFFYLLFDRIMAFFWGYAVEAFSLSGVAFGVSSAGFRLLLPLSMAFANAFPPFVFEIISLFDKKLRKEQESIGILAIAAYAAILIAAGMAFTYLLGLPLLLGQVSANNASLGLPNLIGIGQFFWYLSFSLILCSLVVQIAFAIPIAIRRLSR